MKSFKNYRFGLSAIFVLALGLFVFACKGPDGTPGKDGANGKDGKDGADGSAVCGACHNDGVYLKSRMSQYEQSIHAEGDVYEYGNRTACARCHTHEGFIETLASGLDTTKAMYAGPTTINCRTCHTIHTKYDTTDFKFRTTKPIKAMYDGATIDIGTGNLCGYCHQSRPLAGPTGKDADSISITSSRYYPHHGGQSNVLAGTSAYDLGGGLVSAQAHQKISNSCSKCHMADVPNVEVKGIGGHSFGCATVNPSTSVKTLNTMGCLTSGCHSKVDGATWDVDGSKNVTPMVNDLLAIRTKMASLGWIDTTGSNYATTKSIKLDLVKASTAKPLKITNLQAKALINYFILNQDQSWGVHNPKYYKSVLAQIKNVLGI